LTATPGDESARYLKRLVDDFEFFAEECWRFLGLGAVAPITWVERAMMRAIAHGPRLRGVLGARGTGKTTLAMLYCAWLLLRDQDRKILVVSKRDRHAEEFVDTIGRWFHIIPFLRPLIPTSRNKDSARRILVGGAKPSKDMSLRAEGAENMIEGTRAHTIICDDIETTTNTKTEHNRSTLERRTHEFASILFPNTESVAVDPTEVVVLGTYHHQESLYTKMAARGYLFTSFPMEYPTLAEQNDILNLAPEIIERIEDDPTIRRSDTRISSVFPHRFDEAEITIRRKTGPVYYALQFMLRANISNLDANPLRLSDLIVYDGFTEEKGPASIAWGLNGPAGSTEITSIRCYGFSGDALHGPAAVDSVMAPWQHTIMWVDPAAQGKDKTTAGVYSLLAGRVFCHEMLCFPGEPSEDMMNRIADAAQRLRVRTIYVEEIGLASLFTTMLRPAVKRRHVDNSSERWACGVEGVRDWTQRHQKEQRIIGVLSPVMQNHRLVLASSVAANKDLQKQITRINYQRDCLRSLGDDIVENLAAGCWSLARGLSVDPEGASERARQRSDEYLRYREIARRLAYGQYREPRWLRTG